MTICASELPDMLSLAGGALTLNLAYLNLERFRYSRVVQETANDALGVLESNEGLDFSNTRPYKELQALIVVSNGGALEDAPERVCFRAILWLFRWILVKPTDTIICSAFVIVSAVALLLGSGHSVGLFESTCGFFTEEHVVAPYWMLASGVAAPMAFLLLGRFLQWTCRRLEKETLDVAGRIIQKAVKKPITLTPDPGVDARANAAVVDEANPPSETQ